MLYLDDEKTLDTTEEVVSEQTTEEQVVDVEAESEAKIAQSTKKSTKDNKKGSNKAKGAFSELKKVSWPSFGKVVKQTIVVLSVTAVFLAVIVGIDQLLYLLYDLLTSNM